MAAKMYLPTPFIESRPEILQKVMRENGFATVVTAADGVPFASHVPVLVDGELAAGGLKIRGHVARANPHWKQLANGGPVLVMFQGPHAYVSPSWYADPQNVPTWNYAVVHAHGRAARLAPADLRTLLQDLVDAHERGAERPWRFDSLPADTIDNLLGAIVGFEIAVERLEGKMKLSQNRSPDDQRRVRERLATSADPTSRDVARWMDLLTEAS
jgi:transcriptional regulator